MTDMDVIGKGQHKNLSSAKDRQFFVLQSLSPIRKGYRIAGPN